MKAIVKKGHALNIYGKGYGDGSTIDSSLWKEDGEKELKYLVDEGHCDLIEEPKEVAEEIKPEPTKEEAKPKKKTCKSSKKDK